ncbi:MAG TPA: phenylacetate--CoA ligase family protein [Candidatus Wunengus sp. YC61]|uniref:phenylacetate--CoA ligase family protein n=1 Tax=Candidatus Wunengus sp. YC61 TaxID=3367698 RepID=UPI00402512C8
MINLRLYKIHQAISNFLRTRNLVDMNQSQWWSTEKLRDFQNERLRKIIHYAYHNIPGYRKKFDQAGIGPGDIHTQQDLKKIPPITREELQNNTEFINKALITNTLYTGGSSGAPLKYFESAESAAIRWKSHYRGWSWNGYAPGKRLAVLAGAQGIIGQKNSLTLTGILTSNSLKKNVNKLFAFKPEYLRGYVGSLFILAKYCLDNNIQLKGIKSIDPISENLYEYQRKVMKSAFHCDVFEEYCCNDGGACAWECDRHEGLHYFMERSIIEEVDGEMIVTDLWNRAMPFIRYRNGDSIKFLGKECSCGRKLPLIQVRGRTNDTIITPKGPVGATYLMMRAIRYDKQHRSGIRSVQYIQKPNYKLVVNIVKNNSCSDEEIVEYEKDLRKLVPQMKIKLNFVNDIPTTCKGKRSFVINEDKELLNKWKQVR